MNGMPWHLYIVLCRDAKLYTGVTNNLDQRLKDHNRGKGCRYTACRWPVELVYTEPYPDRSSAQKREAQIKGWSRAKKAMLIRHPTAQVRDERSDSVLVVAGPVLGADDPEKLVIPGPQNPLLVRPGQVVVDHPRPVLDGPAVHHVALGYPAARGSGDQEIPRPIAGPEFLPVHD